MGLASALTTALTGMSAAETQVDVVGNNLANSQTVGFKESRSVFATQFLPLRQRRGWLIVRSQRDRLRRHEVAKIRVAHNERVRQ